ncbi:MAG: tetratricopeptide repeat protein [Candidatus Obscuribacterales bacterium]|nr:tetratricopeptide repeat protein [Candidatus Obscuribacterales bacterium]
MKKQTKEKALAPLLLLAYLSLASSQISYADSDPVEINNEGLNLLNAGHSAEAAAKFSKAIELKPNDPLFESNYGYALLRSGKLEEAMSHLKKSLELNPNFDLAWLNLGVAYQQKGEKQSAVNALERYLKLAANDAQSQRIRASLDLMKKELRNSPVDNARDDYLASITANTKSRWQEMPIKVFIDDGSKLEGYKSEYLDLLKSAFNEWQAASGGAVSYKFVDKSEPADIKVDWTRDKSKIVSVAEGGDTSYELDSKGIKAAHIQLLLLDPLPQKLSPQLMSWITLHEIGHATGLLGHSPDPGDVMYMNARITDDFAHLSERDKATIRKFYTENLGKDWLALNDEGIEAAKAGDYALALSKYQEAMKASPKDSEIPRKNAIRSQYAWAVKLIKSGDLKTPEEHFKAALRLELEKRDENMPLLIKSYANYLRMLQREKEASALEQKYH